MSVRGLFLFFLAAWAATAAAADSCYTVRPSAGQVTYEVSQAGSAFRGKFRRFGGEICLDGDHVNRVDVWLDPASVDSGLPEIDSALKGSEFFAVDRYPRTEFTSRSVDAKGTSYLAHGMLELKGTKKELDVPFTLRQEAGIPLVAGALELQRLEYAVGTGEWADTRWLGSSVKVGFRARLVPP
jgi:polyisoprenoid-binding protein YceI